MVKEIFGIECNTCVKQWRLEVPVGSRGIEAFATICECGNIIVGNIKPDILKSDTNYLKQRYLTNGGFIIITGEISEAKKLPRLDVE